MRNRGIPFTPEYWSAGHGPSRKMQIVRAARDLERKGLLQRLTEPHRDRTTYIIPNITLLRQTIEKLSGQVDVDALCLGLRKTHWGTEHAVQLEQWAATLPQLDSFANSGICVDSGLISESHKQNQGESK